MSAPPLGGLRDAPLIMPVIAAPATIPQFWASDVLTNPGAPGLLLTLRPIAWDTHQLFVTLVAVLPNGATEALADPLTLDGSSFGLDPGVAGFLVYPGVGLVLAAAVLVPVPVPSRVQVLAEYDSTPAPLWQVQITAHWLR